VPRDAVQSGSANSTHDDGRVETVAGPLSGAAVGIGAITVSQLGSVPALPAPGTQAGDYFTVALSAGNTVEAVELRVQDSSVSSLFWWSSQDWVKFEGTVRDPETGELVVTITAGTRPALSDVIDLRLAVGETPATRLAAGNRTATAVAVSQTAYPEPASAGAVVLARDDVYADALTGGRLAAAKKAPLLLSNRVQLSAPTADELQRVLAPGGTVNLLGGTAALSDDVATAVADRGYSVVRVAGADRFYTAVEIAHALGDPEVVLEATGLDYPDAVSAGPAAIAVDGAVLLTAGRSSRRRRVTTWWAAR